jgi:hypothetical protein
LAGSNCFGTGIGVAGASATMRLFFYAVYTKVQAEQ